MRHHVKAPPPVERAVHVRNTLGKKRGSESEVTMKPPPKEDKPHGGEVSKSESSVRSTLEEAKAPAADIVSESLTTVPMEINALDVVSQAMAKASAVKRSHTPRGPRAQPGESESRPKRPAPRLSA